MRIAMCAVGLLLIASRTFAGFPAPKVKETTSPFPAVQVTRLEYDQPRPLKAWAIQIDLTDPDIEFIVPSKTKVDDGFETKCATTLEFAQAEGVQFAVNGSPFVPMRTKAGEAMNINGLHLSRGELISPADKKTYGSLVIDAHNKAKILPFPAPEADIKSARNGLGGFAVVLAKGENLMTVNMTPESKKEPRTAIGLSKDGKFMWWFVVDGRQNGLSEGLTYGELGDWAATFGVTELLNMDGGGSSTLVAQDAKSGEHKVVNAPSGQGFFGTLRQNGNSLGLRIYNRPGDLTSKQLKAIMPRLTPEKCTQFLGPLNRAMARYQINTPLRRAAFLAQLAHESGELKYMEEIASGEAYEGRKNLGNTEPGDGKRFKGRGPIQLTGRANYKKAGEAMGIDLIAHPEKATDADVGCMIAGWFWDTRKLNALADEGNFKEITRKVNGGFNGLAKREAYYERAKEVLGAMTTKQ